MKFTNDSANGSVGVAQETYLASGLGIYSNSTDYTTQSTMPSLTFVSYLFLGFYAP